MSATLALLNGVNASTTGSTFELPVVGRDVSFFYFGTGPGGFGSVLIQVSADGSSWAPSGVSVVVNSTPAVLSFPARYVRAVYDDQGTTGTVSVQALQSDEDG